MYDNYFRFPNSKQHKPPDIVLVSGRGGTGKSHVIHSIRHSGDEIGFPTANIAENNLNAADILGFTVSSLLKDGFEEAKDKKRKVKLPGKSNLVQLCN